MFSESPRGRETKIKECRGSFRRPPSSCRHAIVMMKPAEHGDRGDRAGELRTDAFIGDGNPLADPLVGSRRVEVPQCVFNEDLLKVWLGQDDQVVEALAPDAPQKPFAHRVHERRLHRGAQDVNAGAIGDAIEDRTELVVTIANDELRPLPERRRIAELPRRPRLRRSARHPDMDDALDVHVDDEEREDGTKPDVVGLQEIAGPHRVGSQECPPALSAARSSRPRTAHVPLDRSLRDADAELREFSANAFGSPQPALGRHASDEADDIGSDARLAWPSRAAYATPEETEPRTVPSKHGLRFDQEQSMAPLGKESCEQDEHAALVAAKPRAFDAA